MTVFSLFKVKGASSRSISKYNSKAGSLTGYKPSTDLIHWETKGADKGQVVWVGKEVIQTLKSQVLWCAWGGSGNRDRGSWYPLSTYYGLSVLHAFRQNNNPTRQVLVSLLTEKVTQVRKVWWPAEPHSLCERYSRGGDAADLAPEPVSFLLRHVAMSCDAGAPVLLRRKAHLPPELWIQ